MSKKKPYRKPSKKKIQKAKARKQRISATAKKQSKAPTVVQQHNRDASLVSSLRKNARYRCCECDHAYWFYPGASSPPNVMEDPQPNLCPSCRSKYVEWVNYDADFAPKAYTT